jgi:hypothetical protein
VTLTVPNDSDPAYFDTEYQSRIFQSDLEILQAAIGGLNGVVSGCVVVPDTPASMVVTVGGGTIAVDNESVAITGGDIVISDPDDDPRFDLIIARDTDSVDVIQGSPDVSPVMPSPLEVPGSVALAQVLVPVGASAIAANLIVPKAVGVEAPFNQNLGWSTLTADTTRARSNTATLAIDDDLQITLAANTKYRIRGVIWFKLTSGTTQTTLKLGIGGPASPTHLMGTVRVRSGIAPSNFVMNTNEFFGGFAVYNTTTGLAAGNLSAYPVFNTANYALPIEIEAVIHNGSNGGAFAPWWAQSVASAATTISRMAGSYLEYSVV